MIWSALHIQSCTPLYDWCFLLAGWGCGAVAFEAFISVMQRPTTLRLQLQYKKGALYNRYRTNCKSAQQFQCIIQSSFTCLLQLIKWNHIPYCVVWCSTVPMNWTFLNINHVWMLTVLPCQSLAESTTVILTPGLCWHNNHTSKCRNWGKCNYINFEHTKNHTSDWLECFYCPWLSSIQWQNCTW